MFSLEEKRIIVVIIGGAAKIRLYGGGGGALLVVRLVVTAHLNSWLIESVILTNEIIMLFLSRLIIKS